MFNAVPSLGRIGGSSLLRNGINWGTILSNTSKTLGVINQAIPVFYQVKPMYNNVKTMFRVAKEINKPTSTIKEEPNNNFNSSYDTVINNTNSVKFFA